MSGRQNPERLEAAWQCVKAGKVKADPATGRVYSYAKGRTEGRLLAGVRDRFGHVYTTLHWGGRQWNMIALHRLVWMSGWGKPIPLGMEIDHINRDPSDNRLDNLRLASASQNARNSVHRVGEQNNNSKLTWREVEEIRALRANGMTPRALASAYGTTAAYVYRIVHFQVWKPNPPTQP